MKKESAQYKQHYTRMVHTEPGFDLNQWVPVDKLQLADKRRTATKMTSASYS